MIKSLDTFYNGCLFRSRLEARWAVFYDAIGVKWSYEKEGFDLRFDDSEKVFYLPDFYIKGIGWIEIKPDVPTEEENRKAERLALATKENVYIFFGDIPYPYPEPGDSESAHCFFYQTDIEDVAWDMSYLWCRCTTCGKYGVQYDGRSDRICRHDSGDRGHNGGDQRLVDAYIRARSMRFEKR